MAKRKMNERWAFQHGGRQRTIPGRFTFYRDVRNGKWGFTACITVGSAGKRSKRLGAPGSSIDRTFVFKPGQHVCGSVQSNPRKALAAAARILSRNTRKKRTGAFAGL
jgi:hypothetical protein